MASLSTKHFVCCATVVVASITVALLTFSTTSAIKDAAGPSSSTLLSPSQFASAVMRKLVPAADVVKAETMLRSIAFGLGNVHVDDGIMAYRSKHDQAMLNKHQAKKTNKKNTTDVSATTAPAAFQHWLQNSLRTARLSVQQTNRMHLSDEVNTYRAAIAKGLAKVEKDVEIISKLQFTPPQVEFVATFAQSYFLAHNSSNPIDILKAFGQALDHAKRHDGNEKQYRDSNITAEVAGPSGKGGKEAAAASTSASGSNGGLLNTLEQDAEIVLEDAYIALNETMGFLHYIYQIPPPILTLLGIVFPPLNMLVNGIEAATCLWDNIGALKFSSWFAVPPFLNCFVYVVNMIPFAGSMSEGLTAGIQLFADMVGWTGEYETGANFTLNGVPNSPGCKCP